MSTTLGPPVYLDGPLPVAPSRSLLNSAGVTIVPPGDDRFGVGAAIWPYPPGLPSAWAPCSSGTDRTKADGTGWDLPIFNAYTLELAISCSSITAHSRGFSDRARIAFAAKESFGVAHELWSGAADDMNPFLTDLNLDVLSGTAAVPVAVTPDVGLSYLEEAIGATGIQGVILTTPAVGAAMNGSGGYGLDVRSGALLTTANGTPVALDGGFIGAHPLGHSAPPAGQAWAFATGPIQVRRNGDITMLPDNILQAMAGQTTQNLVAYRAERDYLVDWDTDLQAGILIDWTP